MNNQVMRRLPAVIVICLLSVFLMAGVAYASGGSGVDQAESRADEIYEGAEKRLEELYQDALFKAKEEQSRPFSMASPAKWFIEQMYIMYAAVRDSAVYIGGLSILFGSIFAWLVRYNKHLFRKIILTFIVGVPLLLICFCFGVGILIG